LVLRVLELEGEVILPSFTFFATGHAVLWNGLQPVFADCEPASWNLDPARVAELIGPRTAAIVAVHMYGNPANTDALEALARQRGLKLIFDAAHALGSRREGRPVGSFGDAEVFSLSPTKLLVAGEGGIVATHDSDLACRLRAARNYGDTGNYDPLVLGLNARLTELNALLALHGLAHLEEQLRRRNAIATRFTSGLRALPGIGFQKVRPQDESTYKDFSILIDSDQFGVTRDALGLALVAENVEVKKYFYPPLHQQKLYRTFHTNGLAATERISQSVLSLPIYAGLADETMDRLIEAIARIHAHRFEVAAALRPQVQVAVA
jgi:dTDP-4-amino-4,6-dideoxygalactose transaminase